jgi:hypothetical protein
MVLNERILKSRETILSAKVAIKRKPIGNDPCEVGRPLEILFL